jgi:WD40 repeat protein
VSWSSTGRIGVASGGTVKVFDSATGAALYTTPFESPPVIAFAFSNDGQQLAVAGVDATGYGRIDLFHLPDLASLGSISLTVYVPPSSVAFSPDGTMLAIGTGTLNAGFGGQPEPIKIVHLPDLKEVTTFNASNEVRAVGFSSDGTMFVEVTEAGYEALRVGTWALLGGGTASNSPGVGDARIHLSTGGTVLAFADGSAVINVNPQQSLVGGGGTANVASQVTAADVSPDGKTVVGGTVDGQLYVWPATQQPTPPPPPTRMIPVDGTTIQSLAFSPDGTAVVATSQGGTLAAYHVADGTTLWSVTSSPPPANLLSFASAAKRVVLGPVQASSGGVFPVLDVGTGAAGPSLKLAASPGGTLDRCAASRDATRVACATSQSTATSSNATGATASYSAPPTGFSGPLAFSPDGTTLVAGASNVVRFSTASGAQTGSTSDPGFAKGYAFSDDGTVLAEASSGPKPVHVWRVSDWSLTGQFGWDSMYASANAVAISHDMQWVASGELPPPTMTSGGGPGLTLWRLPDGSRQDYVATIPVGARTLHTDEFHEVAFSPSNARVAGRANLVGGTSAQVYGTLVFRVSDGTPEYFLPLNSSGLAFLDENTLLRGELDGTVGVWCLQ